MMVALHSVATGFVVDWELDQGLETVAIDLTDATTGDQASPPVPLAGSSASGRSGGSRLSSPTVSRITSV